MDLNFHKRATKTIHWPWQARKDFITGPDQHRCIVAVSPQAQLDGIGDDLAAGEDEFRAFMAVGQAVTKGNLRIIFDQANDCKF